MNTVLPRGVDYALPELHGVSLDLNMLGEAAVTVTKQNKKTVAEDESKT